MACALLIAFPTRADTLDGGVDSDAGIPWDYGCPPAPIGLIPMDGGYFMNDARAVRLACLFAATEAERNALRLEVGDGGLYGPPPPGVVLVSAGILLMLLAGGAYAFGHYVGAHHSSR